MYVFWKKRILSHEYWKQHIQQLFSNHPYIHIYMYIYVRIWDKEDTFSRMCCLYSFCTNNTNVLFVFVRKCPVYCIREKVSCLSLLYSWESVLLVFVLFVQTTHSTHSHYYWCAKETYKRDDILRKRHINLSILLTVATPFLTNTTNNTFSTPFWIILLRAYMYIYMYLEKRKHILITIENNTFNISCRITCFWKKRTHSLYY